MMNGRNGLLSLSFVVVGLVHGMVIVTSRLLSSSCFSYTRDPIVQWMDLIHIQDTSVYMCPPFNNIASTIMLFTTA